MDTPKNQHPSLAWLYVGAQFFLIAVCCWGALGALRNPSTISTLAWVLAMVLICAAILLGVWALWSMGSKTFTVLPTPVADGALCQRGPYRWLCHPMYSAVLLLTLGVCVAAPTPLRALAWLLLVGVLIGKLRYEETLLRQRFTQYKEFQQSRHRLIPHVW